MPATYFMVSTLPRGNAAVHCRSELAREPMNPLPNTFASKLAPTKSRKAKARSVAGP